MFECKCTLCDEPEYSDMLMRSMRCDFCKPVPCVQPIEDVMVDEEWTGRFKKHYPGTYILIWWEAYLKPCQTSMMKLFAKIVNDLLTFLNPWYAHGWNIVVTSGLVYGILLSRLGWCPQLLLGIVRQAKKTNMQDCWSFTLLHCRNVATLNLFYRYYLFSIGTGSISFLLREVYSLFW